MTQTAFGPGRFSLSYALTVVRGFVVQFLIGILLVVTAGVLAVMTAFAGLILAAAAIVMRFAGRRNSHAYSAAEAPEAYTLDARRTPRGWTVE